MNKPNENDWKLINGNKNDYIERYCKIINERVLLILSDSEPKHYEKYIKAFRHIKECDKGIARTFDNWRRSNFYNILYDLIIDGIIGNEKMNLSEQTKDIMINVFKIDEKELAKVQR